MDPSRTTAGVKRTQTGFTPADEWGRIGVMTSGFQSPYYGQIAEGIINLLTTRKYQTLVLSDFHSRLYKKQDWTSLADLHCDGLIIHADKLSNSDIGDLMDRYEKVVLLNRYIEQYSGQCIHIDNITGGMLAARCLLDHGHQVIGMIAGPEAFHETYDRTSGFEAELAANDLKVAITVEGDFHEPLGAKGMDDILDSGKEVTAVFVHNDEMAFGAMTTCWRRGVRIPEDLSVIGYDGLAMCDYVKPKLTSIQQPLRLMGEQAARLICDMLDPSITDLPDVSILHTPVLAERESVAPPSDYRSGEVMLTEREAECLTWTAMGKTSWEISVILGVSESTATFHLRNAVIKLKASNRTHAVAKALQAGLIDF